MVGSLEEFKSSVYELFPVDDQPYERKSLGELRNRVYRVLGSIDEGGDEVSEIAGDLRRGIGRGDFGLRGNQTKGKILRLLNQVERSLEEPEIDEDSEDSVWSPADERRHLRIFFKDVMENGLGLQREFTFEEFHYFVKAFCQLEMPSLDVVPVTVRYRMAYLADGGFWTADAAADYVMKDLHALDLNYVSLKYKRRLFRFMVRLGIGSKV